MYSKINKQVNIKELTKSDDISIHCLIIQKRQSRIQKIRLQLIIDKKDNEQYFTDTFTIQDIDPMKQFYLNLEDLIDVLSDSKNFSINIDQDGQSIALNINPVEGSNPILIIYFKKRLQIYSLCHQIQKKCESIQQLSDRDLKQLFQLVSKNLKVIINRAQNKNFISQNKTQSVYHKSGIQQDLQTEIQQKTKQIQKNQTKLQEQIKKIQQKITQKSNNYLQDKILDQKLNKLMQEHRKQLGQIREKSNNLYKIVVQKLPLDLQKRINNILKQAPETTNKFTSFMQPSIAAKKDQPIKNAIDMVDENCNHFTNLQFNGNRIIAKDKCNIFFKINNIKQFKVKILQLHSHIAIGFVSQSYNKSDSIGEDFTKYGCNGYYFDGKNGRYEKLKFVEGDEVTISIDSTKVIWKVQQRGSFAADLPKSKNQKVKWVPFISMMNQNDSVAIISIK